MAGKDAKKTSKNKQRGRPSKVQVTLRCLEAMGGRARLRDLVHELDSANVARIPESTLMSHLERLMQQGVSIFGRFRVAPVIVERLSDTFTGRFLKFVLRGRAKFLDQTYVYSIDHVTRFEKNSTDRVNFTSCITRHSSFDDTIHHELGSFRNSFAYIRNSLAPKENHRYYIETKAGNKPKY